MIEKLNHDGGELTCDSRTPQEVIKEAVALVSKSDVAVVVLGEPFCMSGEAASRSMIGLFENQSTCLKLSKKPVSRCTCANERTSANTDLEDKNLDAILRLGTAVPKLVVPSLMSCLAMLIHLLS
ncbi:MAG: hypothetical protein IPO31_27380 [Candidatus Obscuribacter sp.]|nr:hypothetical protein [Candidatus Obscuribacter sp.]